MRAPCARSCSSQCTSTSGRHFIGRWDAFVPLQGPVRSTKKTQHVRHDFAVHALGVDSRRCALQIAHKWLEVCPSKSVVHKFWLLCRVTYQDTVFDSEEEIVPPTAEEGKQYAIQYQQLKKEMLGRTQRFGGLLAAYLFLTVSGQAGPCCESAAVYADSVCPQAYTAKESLHAAYADSGICKQS